jgi:hypothetical protein
MISVKMLYISMSIPCKMAVAQKESNETVYRLELMYEKVYGYIKTAQSSLTVNL